MKKIPLFAMSLCAVLLAGCAGMGDATSQSAGGTKAAAKATDDATIAANVQQALAADPQTKDLKITAESNQGRVRLKGEARSVAAFTRITAIAKGVPGVTSVDNNVVVCLTCQ
jgi:hyperosmotically inducible periplasmic protein